MAHKTLVDGVAYEIVEFKMMMGGTAYDVKLGKTLVTGTEYTIPFIKIITFYVSGGYEYTAEEGMTWAEFIDSDYNPVWKNGSTPKVFSERGGSVLQYETSNLYTENGDTRITDIIIAGKTYYGN